MTEIERLNELQEKRKELYAKWHVRLENVTQKLFSILNDLNTGPLPLLPLREDEVVSIENGDCFDKDVIWKVRKEIYFVSQDPEDKSYDFGSSFSLYITNKNITLNHGSCGTWGLEDKGQWSRLILMKAIFDHQQDIIDSLSPLIDVTDRNEFYKVDREINQINRDIEKAKTERERAEIRSSLKEGKFLAKIGKRWEYARKENGDIDFEKEGHYIYFYRDFEKIYKITDKTVITQECYNDGSVIGWQPKHHNKIEQIITNIKYNYLAIIDDVNQTPPEGIGSK